MSFKATNDILNVVSSYIDNTDIIVTDESKDRKERIYKTDSIVLIKNQNVYFEVFEKEVIIGHFS